MKKILLLTMFVFCLVVLNIVSIDVISETKKHGTLNSIEGYSLTKPENIDSTYCAPFYIFDGLENANVKVVGKTIQATISKIDLQKLLFLLDAKTIKTENSSKFIVDMYSSRINNISPIIINKQKVNMQISVSGNSVKIGIPSLCGFV